MKNKQSISEIKEKMKKVTKDFEGASDSITYLSNLATITALIALYNQKGGKSDITPKSINNAYFKSKVSIGTQFFNQCINLDINDVYTCYQKMCIQYSKDSEINLMLRECYTILTGGIV